MRLVQEPGTLAPLRPVESARAPAFAGSTAPHVRTCLAADASSRCLRTSERARVRGFVRHPDGGQPSSKTGARRREKPPFSTAARASAIPRRYGTLADSLKTADRFGLRKGCRYKVPVERTASRLAEPFSREALHLEIDRPGAR